MPTLREKVSPVMHKFPIAFVSSFVALSLYYALRGSQVSSANFGKIDLVVFVAMTILLILNTGYYLAKSRSESRPDNSERSCMLLIVLGFLAVCCWPVWIATFTDEIVESLDVIKDARLLKIITLPLSIGLLFLSLLISLPLVAVFDRVWDKPLSRMLAFYARYLASQDRKTGAVSKFIRSAIAWLVACRHNVHEWGEWQYLREGSCEQQRVCAHCQTKETRTIHQWKEWEYLAEGLCKQQRVCNRCHTQETYVNHQWGMWYPADSCEQRRICSRCEVKETRTNHEWGEWGKKEWVGYRTNRWVKYRTCRHCGARDTSWEEGDGDPGCVFCGGTGYLPGGAECACVLAKHYILDASGNPVQRKRR